MASPQPEPTSNVPAADPYGAPFRVAFLGDTGADGERTLRKVRDKLAAQGYDLVVHDGDYLVQGDPCTEERMRQVYDTFDSFAQPFVYTPGDNEWLDCDDPAEELAEIRRVFFAEASTLGQRRLPVVRQEAPYVENARFTLNGVVVGLAFGGGARTARRQSTRPGSRRDRVPAEEPLESCPCGPCRGESGLATAAPTRRIRPRRG